MAPVSIDSIFAPLAAEPQGLKNRPEVGPRFDEHLQRAQAEPAVPRARDEKPAQPVDTKPQPQPTTGVAAEQPPTATANESAVEDATSSTGDQESDSTSQWETCGTVAPKKKEGQKVEVTEASQGEDAAVVDVLTLTAVPKLVPPKAEPAAEAVEPNDHAKPARGDEKQLPGAAKGKGKEAATKVPVKPAVPSVANTPKVDPVRPVSAQTDAPQENTTEASAAPVEKGTPPSPIDRVLPVNLPAKPVAPAKNPAARTEEPKAVPASADAGAKPHAAGGKTQARNATSEQDEAPSKRGNRASKVDAETNGPTVNPKSTPTTSATSAEAILETLSPETAALPVIGPAAAAGSSVTETPVATANPSAEPVASAPAANERTSAQSTTATASSHETSRAPNTTLNEVDRVRFLQRVTRAVQSATDRGGPLRLRLSPPELGSLRLEVTVQQGVMSARIEAETPGAQAALLDNLSQLRERLAQHQIRIEHFDVSLSGGSTDQPSQQQERPETSRVRNGIAPAKEGAANGATAAPRGPVRPNADGQLNYLI